MRLSRLNPSFNLVLCLVCNARFEAVHLGGLQHCFGPKPHRFCYERGCQSRGALQHIVVHMAVDCRGAAPAMSKQSADRG